MPQVLGTSKSIWPFIPNTLPKCSLWLDASDTTTMTFSSGCNVTQWNDKSGSGNNVIGTGTKSGNAITFNGSTQAFSNTSYVFPYLAYSIFMVYSNTTVPASGSYMNALYGASGYPMVGVSTYSPVGPPSASVAGGGGLPTGQQIYIGATLNSNATQITASIGFSGTFYRSTNSGSTWTANSSSYSGYPTNWVCSPDGSNIVCCGNYTFWKSTNGGLNWTKDAYMANITNWYSVAISSNGQTMITHPYYSNLYITTNGGSSWSVVGAALPGFNIRSVAISWNGSKMFAAGQSNPCVYYSLDYGVTWTGGAGLPNYQANAVSIACSGDGVNVIAGTTSDAMWRSTDSGANWSKLNSTIGFGSFVAVASSSNGVNLAAIACPAYYGTGNLMVSLNSGTTWTTVTWPTSANNQYFPSGGSGQTHLWMSSDGSTVATTTNVNDSSSQPSGYLVITNVAPVLPSATGVAVLASSFDAGYLTPIATSTTSNIVSVVYAPSTLYPYVNGSAETTLTTTTTPATTGLYIGGPTNRFNGSISEILVYQSNLIDGDRRAVEGYLSKKWSVTFPSTHPFYTLNPYTRAFSILDIGTCSLWLDASDTTTMTFSSGCNVTSWRDKSGAGKTMAGGGVLSGSNMIIGGFNSGFSNTSYPFPVPAYTIFAVFSNTTAPSSTSSMPVIYGGSGNPNIGVYGSSKYIYASPYTYTASSTDVLVPNVAASSNVLVSLIYNSSTLSPFVNGNAETPISGSTNNYNTINIGWGGGGLFVGSISEVLIFSSALTIGKCQQVEAYLAAKWNIQSNLVSTHSYKNRYPTTTQPPQFQDISPGNWYLDWSTYMNAIIKQNNPTGATIVPTIGYGTFTSTGSIYGSILGPNGLIYGMPALNFDYPNNTETNITIFNPSTGTATYTTGGAQTGASLTSNNHFAGVLAPNGNIYIGYESSSSCNVLVVNTTTNVLSSITQTNSGYSYKGGVLHTNGNIYFIPYASSDVMVVNPSTNALSTIHLSTSGYDVNTSSQGAVLGPNDKIYCIPTGTTNIVIINPNTKEITFGTGGDLLNPPISGQQWVGGVLAPNGNIYCIPFRASNALIINTSNDSVSYTSGGGSLSPLLWNSSTGAAQIYACGALAPNGNIYCIPVEASNILIINTFTNTVSYGTGGNSLSPPLSSGQRNGGCTLAPNGNIYAFGKKGNKVLIISNTCTLLPTSNYLLSTFTNKY